MSTILAGSEWVKGRTSKTKLKQSSLIPLTRVILRNCVHTNFIVNFCYTIYNIDRQNFYESTTVFATLARSQLYY